MKTRAFDIETLINCFTVVFVNCEDENETDRFVLHESRDDSESLLEFMDSLGLDDTLVGYNSLNFDMPVLYRVCDLIRSKHPVSNVIRESYLMAQSLITEDVRPKYPVTLFNHIDLFKLYHFDNESKRTSLKWIQCHLDMENVQDMPHPHDVPASSSQIEMILSYNLNDVRATVKMYNHRKTAELLELRQWAMYKYGLKTGVNTSNSHMGEMIFMSKLGDIPPPDKSSRRINIRNLILPIISFQTSVFQKALERFQKMSFNSSDERPKMSFDVVFKGMKYSFGLGGIHAAKTESENENVESIDVKSFYPNVAISFGFYPKHAGEAFVTAYKELYADRLSATSTVANLGIKEALNSVFGKSNSEFSPLYYPEFTYSITINGQLLMTMLAERLSQAGEVIMVNTDGMEVIVKDNDRFTAILEDWKKLTGMTVTRSRYKKLFIRDVNNYIGILENGKTKTKGCYEVDKEFNKDPSGSILPISVLRYYLKGISIEDTILNHQDMSDFYMFKRAKTGKLTAVTGNGQKEVNLPKTIRYVASKKGLILFQKTDSMNAKVHADCYITVINDLKDASYELDRNWYIREAKKLLIQQKTDLFS